MITRANFEDIYKNEKVTFSKLKGKRGIYFIISKRSNAVRYVGFSGSDIYKTALRHFESWKDRTQVRVTYNRTGYKLKFFIFPNTATREQIHRYERILIRAIKPKDNPIMYKEPIYTATDENAKIKREIAKLEAMKKETTFGASVMRSQIEKDIKELKEYLQPITEIKAPF